MRVVRARLLSREGTEAWRNISGSPMESADDQISSGQAGFDDDAIQCVRIDVCVTVGSHRRMRMMSF